MVLDNSPALGWVRMTNAILTYNNTIYTISNECTEKKYVYWDVNRPHAFIYSNEILEQTSERFLVLINDKGRHTNIIPTASNFNVSFEKDITTQTENKLNALYKEFTDSKGVFKKQFTTIQQTQNSILETLGSEETSPDGSVLTRINNIEKTSEGIRLTLTESDKKAKEDKFRKDLIEAFLNTSIAIGTVDQDMKAIMMDGKLDGDGNVTEQAKIGKSLKLLEDANNVLIGKINEILKNEEILKKYPEAKNTITNTIVPRLQKEYENLKNMINTTKADGLFDSNDITQVSERISSMTTQLSSIRNSVDRWVVMGIGGNITDTLAEYWLGQKSASIKFSEKFNNIETKYTELKLSIDGVESTVRDNKKNLESKITQTANSITSKVSGVEGKMTSISQSVKEIQAQVNGLKMTMTEDEFEVAFNKMGNKYGKDKKPYMKFDRDGLTVYNGHVATDILTVPSGHEPIIRLFNGMGNDGLSIDGTSGDMRLRYDSYSYIKIINKVIEGFVGGEYLYGSPSFKIDDDGIWWRNRYNHKDGSEKWNFDTDCISNMAKIALIKAQRAIDSANSCSNCGSSVKAVGNNKGVTLNFGNGCSLKLSSNGMFEVWGDGWHAYRKNPKGDGSGSSK